ncbi:MAG: hypothetical protein AB1512_27665 [Thermodesulfobacteriota bacterium]
MTGRKPKDLTLEVLVSIRDEIRALRDDTNRRFEQMDRRFERIEADIAQIRKDINYIVAKFDRDFLLMATDVDHIKERLRVCEERLGIQ